MTILVTGATGFLGSRIVEHLETVSTVKCIIATGRKFSTENKVISNKVHYVLGDLENKNFTKSLFNKKIDIVINCASLSSPWGSIKQFYNANVLTQSNLIKESERNFVSRFIYISTPSIYFNFKDAVNITEQHPKPNRMVNNYAKTKWQAECLLHESDLDYIILRPRALIGRGDTVIMPRLIRAYKEKKLRIVGSGKNLVDLTSVKNMVEAVRLSMLTKNVNSTYNISNGSPVNLWETINKVLSALEMPKIKHKINSTVLYTIATMSELWANIFGGREPALTRYSVGVLAKSFSFDISHAKQNLNYKPKQTTEKAIEEFVEWYKNSNRDQG